MKNIIMAGVCLFLCACSSFVIVPVKMMDGDGFWVSSDTYEGAVAQAGYLCPGATRIVETRSHIESNYRRTKTIFDVLIQCRK